MIAYDLDNTISSIAQGYERRVIDHYQIWQNEINAKLLIRPLEETFMIITARPSQDWFATKAWCILNDLHPYAIQCVGEVDKQGRLVFDVEKIAWSKIRIMQEYGIKKYYEDDDQIVEVIRKCYPQVEVIHVKHNVVYEVQHTIQPTASHHEQAMVEIDRFTCVSDAWKKYYYWFNQGEQFNATIVVNMHSIDSRWKDR